MVNSLHHTVRNLLTNLDTCIISSLLLIVTSIDTFVQTLDELIHISGINSQASYEIVFQTLSLSHTDSITHCIDVTLQASLRSAIAT